jgi:hypothetical protein
VYPEIAWDTWKFTQTEAKFWNSVDNQKLFLERISPELGVKCLDDWYKIKPIELRNRGGGKLLDKYDDSMYRVFTSLYPEHNWVVWGFGGQVPEGFWDSRSNRRAMFDWLADRIGVQKFEDWYNVLHAQVM